MNATTPPRFCASARTCWQSVVLPLDSGPKISVIRPRGTPPTPRARSSATEPVETAGTFCASRSPRRMIEPRPNCFSIWRMAALTARPRSPSPFFVAGVWVATTGASIVFVPLLVSMLAPRWLSSFLVLGLGLALLAPGLDDLDLAHRWLICRRRHRSGRVLRCLLLRLPLWLLAWSIPPLCHRSNLLREPVELARILRCRPLPAAYPALTGAPTQPILRLAS